jgi:poly-gamma-glutamate system protein
MIKKHQWIFLGITILAVALFYVEDYYKAPEKTAFYVEKLEASRLAAKAMAILREEAIQRHISTDSINDPNETYLVGTKYSIITAHRVPLTDVLVSLNPNFAAAVVEMLTELKFRRDDLVAVNTTGTFPGLNIAVLSACEVLGIEPIIITAVSSASYGANNPAFTWLDMETHLREREIFSFTTYAASIGGEKDNGEGISPEGRTILLSVIERNNARPISSASLAENIAIRDTMYHKLAENHGKPLKAYIDIGGTITGYGQTVPDTLVKPGINRYSEQQFFSNYGLIQRMVEKQIPILFLGDIKQLALSRGLSITTIPQPQPGQDELFFKERYSVKLAVFFLLCIAVMLFLYIRIEMYLKRK